MVANWTLCLGTPFHSISEFECQISQILGSTILLVAFLSTLFNLRFLYWSANHGRHRSRHNLFVSSMILSSTMVICVMVPSVFLQSFSCRRLCSLFYCRLEGFISYLNGCVHMFMLMMISIIRYITVFRQGSTKRYVRRNSNIGVVISWILGFAFAVPPLFHLNEYIPEGLGFHCGLNWFDQSFNSYIYLFSAMLFVYFIPLIVLCTINGYVYCRIRRLIYQAMAIHGGSVMPSIPMIQLTISKRTSPAYLSLSSVTTHSYRLKEPTSPRLAQSSVRSTTRRAIDPSQIRHLMRLNRLQADRYFALATIFLVGEYLLSWTPYACVALSYLFHMKLIVDEPLLMTICATIAKISMIINPFIYILAIRTKQLKTILFCQTCSCFHCRMKKGVL